MRRTSLFILVLAAACSSVSPATTTTTAVPTPERLVVLDARGNLRTMDAEGAAVETIVEGSDRLVLQPTWSPGGERLAWVEVVLAGGPEDVAVVTALADGSGRTRTAVSNPPFYLSWAPDGDRLILLRNGVVELEAGLVDLAEEDPAEQVIATGQPFYFAWDPSGRRILANVGVTDRLGTIDLEGEESSLGVEPGLFQAPAWVGEHLYWVRDDDGAQTLVRSATTGEDVEVIGSVGGFLHFLVSPDGGRVAYRELDLSAPAVTASFGAQDAVAGELVVADLDSGEATTVDEGNPFAFWWSPDSSKLLFLSVGDDGFMWRMWDGETVTDFETFTPSRTYGRDYLPFFDQFASSIEMWAPDSGSFVYAGRSVDGDRSRIWVQPLDGPVRAVADGVFAAFVPAP